MFWQKKHKPTFDSHPLKPPIPGDPSYAHKMSIHKNWLAQEITKAELEHQTTFLSEDEKAILHHEQHLPLDLHVQPPIKVELHSADKKQVEENDDRPRHLPTSQQYFNRYEELRRYLYETSGVTLNHAPNHYAERWHHLIFEGAATPSVRFPSSLIGQLAETNTELDTVKAFLAMYVKEATHRVHLQGLDKAAVFVSNKAAQLESFAAALPGLINTVALEMAFDLEYDRSLRAKERLEAAAPKALEPTAKQVEATKEDQPQTHVLRLEKQAAPLPTFGRHASSIR